MNDMTDNQENNEIDLNFDEFENFLNSDESLAVFDNESTNLLNEQSVEGIEISDQAVVSFDNIRENEANVDFYEGKQEPYFESQIMETAVEEAGFVDNENNNIFDEPVTEEVFQAEEVAVDEPVTEEAFQAEEAAVDEPVTEEAFQAEEVAVDEPVAEEVFQTEEVADDEPVAEEDSSQEKSLFNVALSDNLKYLKWYSGNSNDDVYEFGKSSQSAKFKGSASCNTIHINVGYDTYGWNVQFSDGVTMSLRDVREYQIRNGKLPNASGKILYGKNILTFEKVDRIVIYEAVKYFSYGV